MRTIVLRLCCLFFSLVLPMVTQAQPDFGRTRDSLLTRLRSSPDDTSKVYQYLAVGLHYEASQLDSAGYYYRLAGALSERLHYPKGLVRYANYYTYILNVKGKLADALQLNLRALALARQVGDEVLYAKCLGNVGASYQLFEDHEEAVKYNLQAIGLLEKHNENKALTVGYANLTDLYDKLGQYGKAEQYGRKSLTLARQMHSDPILLSTLNNLSVPLQHQKKYAEANRVITEGLRLSRQSKNGFIEASFIQNLSNVALLTGQYGRAETLAQQSLLLGRALHLPAVEANALLSIGIARLHQQDYQQAALIASQGEQFIRLHDLREHLADFLLLHSDAELGLGHPDRFDYYRAQYDSLQEQRVGQKVVLNTQRLEAQFQSKAQAQQINQLRQSRQIQELTIIRKNYQLYGSIVLLLVLLLAGTLLYRTLSARQVIARQTAELQQQRIRELEKEKQLLAVEAVIQGQEEERSRLAKDLHDGLGGLLSSVKMTLAASLTTTQMPGLQLIPQESVQSMVRAIGMLDESIAELRRVARNMMPESLIRFGLVDALHDYCDYIDQSGTLTVRFQAVDFDERLPANTEITLFRITQELLNNVVKHAGATEAIVQLVRYNNQCSLTVEDNGRGFDTNRLEQHRGSGWTSVRSRVDYLGGQVDVQSQADTGTSVMIEVPVRPDVSPAGHDTI